MQRKIRVLMVGHTYLIGVNQQKLSALLATGEVEIALLVPKYWRAQGWNRSFQLDPPPAGITTYSLRSIANGRTGAYMLDVLGALHAIREFQPDIIHVEQEVFALASFEFALLAKLYNKPAIFFGWENTDRELSFLRRATRRVVLSSARAVICGNREGECLVRRWGFRGETTISPQLGVDPSLFRRRGHSKREAFTIGFVGRLMHEKGVDILLHAVGRLKAAGTNMRVVLIGAGPLQRSLQELAGALHVTDQVTWRSFLPHQDVPEAMQEFDVLVLPSRTVPGWKEQFGHVLIEAMAMGLPVIGSNCGEIPNVIGRNDLLFPENDYAALHSVLQRMVADDDWRTEVSAFCTQRVQQHYTHERVAEHLVDLYRRVMADEYACLEYA